MNPAVQSTVFVDGNNVMGSRPDGWWRDRAKAARRLVADIAPLALGHGGAWTIVFDGQAPPRRGVVPGMPHRAFTLGMAAATARMTESWNWCAHAETGRHRWSTPPDAALRDRVHALGAQVAGARALLNEIVALRGAVGQSAHGTLSQPRRWLRKWKPRKRRAAGRQHHRRTESRAIVMNGADRSWGGNVEIRHPCERLRRPAADIGSLARGCLYMASRWIAPTTALRASARG